MKKFDFSRYYPLGYNFGAQRNTFLTVMLCSGVYSLIFYIRYIKAYFNLYGYRNGKKELIEGRMMPEFHTLVDNAFFGFSIVVFIALSFIVLNYVYHFQGTKSIYLMRRLPNRKELHIRCITAPFIFIIICVMVAFILLLIDLGIYIIFTPKQCLYSAQWQRLWSVIL